MRMFPSSFIFAYLFFISNAMSSEGCSGTKCILPTNYDRKTRPNAEKGVPVDIKFQIYIESFGSIDVAKMEMELFGYMIQRWQDKRLANLTDGPIILASHDTGIIWLPDVYCINCRQSNLDSGNNKKESLARIEKNGNIYFSVGISLISSCAMDLRVFPFDRQSCDLKFSSYAYNMSYINYTWVKKPFVKSTELDQFVVADITSQTKIEDYNTHLFPISIAIFTFERRIGFYILQLYVPTAMLVCLSWAMFCLDQEHLGDRITIGLTLFLTMIFLHGYANTSLPKVSYIKSVDLFMVVSLSEILLILLESLIVTNMYVRNLKQKEKYEQKELASSTALQSDKRRNFEVTEESADFGNHNCVLQGSKKYTNRYSRELELDVLSKEEGHDLENSEISGTNEIQDFIRKDAVTQGNVNGLCRYPLYLVIEKGCSAILPLSYVAFNVWYWINYLYLVHINGH